MIRRVLIAIGLFATAALQLHAQNRHPTRTDLVIEISRLVRDLRASAAHGDWATMSPSFPEEGVITARIHAVVTGGPGSGGLSFWTPSAVPDFDRLAVAPVKDNLVAISIPFIDNGNPGAFGAVFERKAGVWQLTCFREAFPPSDLAPGCVADMPRRM